MNNSTESQVTKYVRTMFDSSACFPIAMYIFLFIIYVLCFVNLYKPNVEIIGFGLLFALHTLMTYSIISSIFASKNVVDSIKMYILPQAILYVLEGLTTSKWDGGVSVKWVLTIGLLLMLLSLVLLMKVFLTLHTKFSATGKPIDMGDPKNTKIKEDIKKMYITQTVIIWILYSVYTNNGLISEILDYYIFPKRRTIMVKNKSIINVIYVILGISLLTMSSYTVFSADRLAKNTGSYNIANKNR